MEINEYAKFVNALMSPASTANERAKVKTAVFGLCAESGEFLDHIKKILFHGATKEEHHDEMVKELGDIMFYLTFAATSVCGSAVEELTDDEKSIFDPKDIDTDDSCGVMLGLAGVTGILALDTLSFLYEEYPREDYMSSLQEALYDILQFVEFIGEWLGVTLDEIIDKNFDKLSNRYKSGKFSVEEFKAKEALKCSIGTTGS